MPALLRPAVLTAAALLLLAGCASPAPAPDAEDPSDSDSLFDDTTESAAPGEPEEAEPVSAIFTDPCSMFTKEDAEALTGIPLSDGQAFTNPDTPGCTYPPDPNSSTAQAEVAFNLGAQKFYDIDVALGHEFVEVPGLGDEAWVEPEGGTIFFVKDGMWVSVHIVKLNDAIENVEPLKEAAAKIAARM